MSIQLTEPAAPAFLKIGFFGETGSGKTFTAAKVLSQFIRQYAPDRQLAMFDTEPSAGYIKDMVKDVSGKPLQAIHSRSFSDMLEFTKLCVERGHIALIDSATHPWRSLVADYLDSKRSRVQSAGGRTETVRLSLKDWGPIKDIWGQFSELYCYGPIHICLNGREGDKWDTVEDEEGNEEMRKVGVKMKTETETGYEPSLLVQMRLVNGKHYAFVVKDRFDALTGQMSKGDPDIEFFMPHIKLLQVGGKHAGLSKGDKVFSAGSGPSWETIKARRTAILEGVKDDLLLVYPGRTADENKSKVSALRKAFGTSSWTELESDTNKWDIDALGVGRKKLARALKASKNSKAKE